MYSTHASRFRTWSFRIIPDWFKKWWFSVSSQLCFKIMHVVFIRRISILDSLNIYCVAVWPEFVVKMLVLRTRNFDRIFHSRSIVWILRSIRVQRYIILYAFFGVVWREFHIDPLFRIFFFPSTRGRWTVKVFKKNI